MNQNNLRHFEPLQGTKRCQCTDPSCAKCLGLGCEDNGCKVHSKQDKIARKLAIIKDLEVKDDKDSKIMAMLLRDEVDMLENGSRIMIDHKRPETIEAEKWARFLYGIFKKRR